MDPNQRRMTDSVLNLTLEILYLLTGEDYTVVKKTTGQPVTPANQSRGSVGWSRSRSPVTAQSVLSPSHGENNDKKVLELANRIIHFLTGEVWQYLLGHGDLAKGVVMENRSTDTSKETNDTATWEELGPISTPLDHTDNSFIQIKNEPGSLDVNSDTSTHCEHTQYAAAQIKLETVSCEEGHHTYTEIFSSGNSAENSSTFIKEEYTLSEEGDMAFFEPSYTELASIPDNPTETSNIQIIDHNAGTHPDLENTFPLVETKTTCTPLTPVKSQIPVSDGGICFSNTSNVASPQEGHVRSKPFACSECSRCFSTQLSLFRHERIHTALGKKGGCSTEAGSEFASTDSADDPCYEKSPVWTRGGQELGTTNGSSQGSNHQTNFLDNVEQKSLIVDGGGKKIRTSPKSTTSVSLDHHTGSFNTLGPADPWKFKKASCFECGEVFPFRPQMGLHQRDHLNKSQFSCSECGKCFTSNSHLIVHQRVHTGEKPFSCSACTKRFATKSTLVIHQRVHTREKPYSCTECRKCFPCNSQLVIHQRTHTGEKPYSCLECGKGFISNSDLLRHRRVHTGERPFKCIECAKCFSQKSHLREHHKTHRR
ncbi:uncharacterized protein LOC143956260 [Lithobates pipiens]